MKGIVFTEFLEMVEQTFSPEVADTIIDESDLESGGVYTSVGTYDHHELVAMVVKLSEITQIPVPALVKAFGNYLFPRFYEKFPIFFEGVNDALTFLQSIESVIHVEVKKLYPDAELPRFDITRPDNDTLIMIYRSQRHFEDLAEGLMESCISHFGQAIAITREPIDDKTVRFILKRTM